MLKGIRHASTGGIVVVSFAFMLSACGGGDSDSGSSGGPATELKPGVYDIGTKFMGGPQREGLSLISPTTGEFVSGFVDSIEGSEVKSFAFGNIKFSSGKISGSIEDYKATPSPWVRVEGTLSGEVVSSERADLIASKNGNVNSISVLMRRSRVSNSGVTKERMSSTYNMSGPGDSNISSITIAPDGALTGTDQQGCVFNGSVDIPDEKINVFEVTYTASNCPGLTAEGASASDRNGEYAGLGTYDSSDNKLTFYVRNDTVAWMFEGTR